MLDGWKGWKALREEEITIQGEESYNAWVCEQVIKAIGRGFTPKDALKLTQENHVFELIDIMDYARNQNDKFRLRGRVIGEDGKTRERIERETNCEIVVYGKTVGVIGPAEDAKNAIKAVEMLLEGAQTSTVTKFLEKEAKKKIRQELL